MMSESVLVMPTEDRGDDINTSKPAVTGPEVSAETDGMVLKAWSCD